MEKLFRKSGNRIRQVNTSFKRYLYYDIDWTDRLIGVTGSRGVGKTTMLLQYIRLNLPRNESVIYLSLDDLYFTNHTLGELVEDFVNKGGKYLFLDEVHKYANWSLELKNIYDNFPDLKIVFSGSSVLQIFEGKADLSRRVSFYNLQTLSFREFLSINDNIHFETLDLESILKRHMVIADGILNRIKPLARKESYFKMGMYPFFRESKTRFFERLHETINQILENDIPAVTQIEFQQILKLKKLLYVISTSAPFIPNISKLANKTNMQRKTIYKYLDILENACLINTLHHKNKGMSAFNKPEKIYLDNPNLMWLFSESDPNIGNVRETWFYNQLKTKHKINYTKETDFLVDDQYFFEIGGKNKTTKQIQGLSNAFVVSDDIETGMFNKIPLWLFGFLY
jgi:predicted AAA+ superfamily ATPase